MRSICATRPDLAGDLYSEASLLTIDLAALSANWLRLALRSAPAECAGVVKADGYGLGLEPVMKSLLKAGCRTFFVASLPEGERARSLDDAATIYVLEGLAPGSGPRLKAALLSPVLGSLDEIDEWTSLGETTRRIGAALHIDTGMNRAGLPLSQAAQAAARLTGGGLSLVMSHLVSAQRPDAAVNDRQIAAFAAARGLFPGIRASLCNSSGIFLPNAPHLDLTRPGYALYGGNPTPGAENPMRAVVKLEARVVATRDVAAGESVGYDAIWTASRPTRLATLGLGYADGVPISAAPPLGRSGAQATIGGRRCPYVGRVSMDFIVIDVTDAGPVARGDYVEILGDSIGIDDLAACSGTIGYEILTRLGPRSRRRHLPA